MADAELTTPARNNGVDADASAPSARRETSPSSKQQRNRLTKWLFAGCKNLYYLQFALLDGLAAALWRGCSFGQQRAENVLSWTIPCPAVQQPDELLTWLRQQGLQVIDAEHALYLPPQDALQSLFPEIANFYPPNCGFKILKDLRLPAESNYLAGRSGSALVRRRLTGSPAEQLVTANYMHTLGIGPRMWDVCCWRGDGNELTVFVVDHVAGRTPTDEECRGFLNRLRQIERESHLNILMPRWETQDDFESPACRGNLIAAADHTGPQYVDFQNFRLNDPAAWTQEIVQRTVEGEPASRVPHATREEAHAILNELRDLGIRFRGRVARQLDCGCGELLNAALNAGAAWVCGSTTRGQRDATVANLFSQGAGRFTITAEEGSTGDNRSYLPPVMHARDADAVLFCRLGSQDPEKMLRRITQQAWTTLVCLADSGVGSDESILTLLNSHLEFTLPVSIAQTQVDGQRMMRLFVVNKA